MGNQAQSELLYAESFQPELGKSLYKSTSNILHITSYFYKEVIHILQLHITLSKSNSYITIYFQSNNIT